MGKRILRDLLMNNDEYEPDDEVYVLNDVELSPDSAVEILPFDSERPVRLSGRQYMLGIEQLRGAIEAVEEHLGRPANDIERFKAVKHFAEHDSFIPIDEI